MRSSISDSRALNPTEAMVLLLALAGCYLGALELAARLLLPHLSQAQHRSAADYGVARSLPRRWPDGSASVLIVGNSLLVDGIDRVDLQRRMPGYHIALYPVEGTTYLDWYFGLRRLFSEGARPSLVILAVSVRHVLSDSTNGEAFARSIDRKSTRLNSSHITISYAVFCLKKKRYLPRVWRRFSRQRRCAPVCRCPSEFAQRTPVSSASPAPSLRSSSP